MSNAAYIVLVILIIFGFIGLWKGFFRIVFTTATLIACIFLAGAFTGPATAWLKNNTRVYESMNSRVSSLVDSRLSANTNFNNVLDTYGGDRVLSGQEKQYILSNPRSISETINSYFNGLPIPSNIKSGLAVTGTDIKNQVGEVGATVKSTVVNSVSAQITNMIMSILVYLGICLIVYIIMRIIFAILKLAKRFPGVSTANRLGGLAIGIIEGLFVVWLLMCILVLFGASEAGQSILKDIHESKFLTYIYDMNPIWKLIGR